MQPMNIVSSNFSVRRVPTRRRHIVPVSGDSEAQEALSAIWGGIWIDYDGAYMRTTCAFGALYEFMAICAHWDEKSGSEICSGNGGVYRPMADESWRRAREPEKGTARESRSFPSDARHVAKGVSNQFFSRHTLTWNLLYSVRLGPQFPSECWTPHAVCRF